MDDAAMTTGVPTREVAEPRPVPAEIEPTSYCNSSFETPIAIYDLGGSGSCVLFAHATGFCGAVLAPLARRLPAGFRSICFDLRAHGRSGRPKNGDFSWQGFADDALAVLDALGIDQAFGFGHSCGGAALLLAEQARPGTFSSLYLWEPIVFPGPSQPPVHDNPLSIGALKRRERFAGPEEAIANFSSKPPFDVLHREVLNAYVGNGFKRDRDGVVLCCQREDESEIYAHGFSHTAYARLPEIRCPVTLACGSNTDAMGPFMLEVLAAKLPCAVIEVFEGLGHFGPLQEPDRVASHLARRLVADGGA